MRDLALKKTVRGNAKSSKRSSLGRGVQVDTSKEKVTQAIAKYKLYLEAEKNYSPYTVQNYLKDIQDFSMFLEEQKYGHWLRIKTENIARYYISHLVASNYSRKSIARKVSSLRAFYRYLVVEGMLTMSYFDNVETPKIEKQLPHFLYQNEIEMMFASIDKTKPLGLRDYALLELLYGSGLRVSEICAITEKNLDFPNEMIKVLDQMPQIFCL